MKFQQLLLGALLVVLGLACEPGEETLTEAPSARLNFSLDTVFFDTVFTQRQTVTKRFKVFNPESNAVEIDVELEGLPQSPFQLVVNGQEKNKVNKLFVRGEDSILVLVEARIDGRNRNNPFLINDSIRFTTNGNIQHVNLSAYGQDAHYFRDSVLSERTVWQADRPYIVIGNLVADTGVRFSINPGVQVHMAPDANLFMQSQSRLLINGSPSEPVVFQGLRLEEKFDNQPCQWGSLVFLDDAEGSIEGAEIKNGFRGIQANLPNDTQSARLNINRTLIKNMCESGIRAFNSRIQLANSQIINSGRYQFIAEKGGRYELWHNTMAYSGTVNFSREEPSVIFADFFEQDQEPTLQSAALRLDFRNNIVSGNQDEEFLIQITRDPGPDQDTSQVLLLNNILTTTNQSIANDSTSNIPERGRYDFRNPFEFDFRLDTNDQVARDAGDSTLTLPRNFLLGEDFAGEPRELAQPDIGAFELQE